MTEDRDAEATELAELAALSTKKLALATGKGKEGRTVPV